MAVDTVDVFGDHEYVVPEAGFAVAVKTALVPEHMVALLTATVGVAFTETL